MGAPRQKPERLAGKLLQIRLYLDISQGGMLERLGLSDEFGRSRISAYELGNREPPLLVLLKYARCVGVSTDVLIDDELDLPGSIVKAAKVGIVRHKPGPRARRTR
jgi:transcriptional regulator with XRE-family HTH domain